MNKETLEAAIRKAAAELGWTASFATEYDYKLTPEGKIKIPDKSYVYLRGTFFQALEVRIYYYSGESDSIHLWTGFPDGFAGEKKVLQYIDAVSRNLP